MFSFLAKVVNFIWKNLLWIIIGLVLIVCIRLAYTKWFSDKDESPSPQKTEVPAKEETPAVEKRKASPPTSTDDTPKEIMVREREDGSFESEPETVIVN